MTNNLRKAKQDLCAYIKRCKNIHYSESLLIAFLIAGITGNLFPESKNTNLDIENQKQLISTSIKDIHTRLKGTRKENDKLLKNTNLELIQLMEQGDYVIKSPWSSWQYGMNYFYNNWNGTYKGRGDKKAKYPYEGIYKRSLNIYERAIARNSPNYELLNIKTGAGFASSSSQGYGIASVKPVKEPIVSFDVTAGIRPREISKSTIVISDKTPVIPKLPKAIEFTPPKPMVRIPSDPYTPNPPTFAVVLGADCNQGCYRAGYKRQLTKRSFFTSENGIKNRQNERLVLHYTWANNQLAERAYAFKMYKDETWLYSTNRADYPTPGTLKNPEAIREGKEIDKDIFFNSYNFGNEFDNSIVSSQGINRNNQHFFIGGSRLWEIDDSSTGIFEIKQNRTINLGGILTLGMVSQENGTTLLNSGTITDENEKNDDWIKKMPVSGTDAQGDYYKIYGPSDVEYIVRRSKDGYVGYKVGIAQVEENSRKRFDALTKKMEKQELQNKGTIDFRGERSIGMYVYLPRHLKDSSNNPNYDIMYTWAKVRNQQGASILLSGKESYGMKIAANGNHEADGASPSGTVPAGATPAEMINEGTIELRVNPDGKDKADNSAAMALMEDKSVFNHVKMKRGNTVNEGTGTIKLQGVQNSLGMFINIDSDMINKGKIEIDSNIEPDNKNQPMNVAMRSDYGTGHGGSRNTSSNALVINDTNGKITLNGNFAIGQLSRVSRAVNKGEIITDKAVNNSIGMATLGGTLDNEGTITVAGNGAVSNNIGAFLNSYKYTDANPSNNKTYNPTGTLGQNSNITVSGNNSTGVLINGSSNSSATPSKATLKYGGNVTVSGNGVSGIVVGDNNSGVAEVTAENTGTITVNNGTGVSAGIYEYIDGATKIKKGSYGIIVGKNSSLVSSATKNVNVNANIKGAESIGTYAGENAILEIGNHTVNAYEGAVNYAAADKGKITLKGTGSARTGQKSLLFYLGSNTNGKISINNPMTATIEGGNTPSERGNAFYYVGTGGNFGKTQIEAWAKNNFGNGASTTLGNLTLNMNKGSRLFIAQNVGMDLSDTTGDTISKVTGANINGTDYKTFMLYLSKMTINQDVSLDKSNDAYNQLEISNSSITNASTKTIAGTRADQVAMAQENSSSYTRDKVTLSNEGKISLSGTGSTGIYGKFGELYNKATGIMTVGDKSTAIYGTGDSIIENEGKITIGSSSTGLYSEGSVTKAITNKSTGIIESSGNDSVAISYKPKAILSPGVTLENAGKITMTGDRNTAVYATGTSGYHVKNSGIITLGDSASISNPNVSLYTDHNTVTLENTGTINSGNNTIGVYGHAVQNSGNLKIGNASVAVYSQSGNVNLTGGSITTGTDEAVGVYTVGNGQNITNSATAFNIGDNSFGFVNVGKGNTITSKISNVGLGNKNVYLYSNDTTGTVKNFTNITSTGKQNYAIYSAGKVTNNANIDLSSGKGSVAIYSIKGGTATNDGGTITVGESYVSDSANSLYSIGMGAGYDTTDTGNIINKGTIKVNGKFSIAMYASGAGSTAINEAGSKIILDADNTTGIYADNGATAINRGTITTSGSHSRVVGVYLGKGSVLHNTGNIHIDSSGGAAIYLKGGTVANYGTITVAEGAKREGKFETPPTGKEVGGVKIHAPSGATTATITFNGVPQTPVVVNTKAINPISVSASSIGLYVNTSGVNYTKSIDGLQKLTNEADLIVGTEATASTNSKYILVKDPNIINPYRRAMLSNPNIKWNVYSGSIGWIATPTLDSDGVITSLYMAKIPYTEWAGKQPTPMNSTDTYNFTNGLEQLYGVETLGSRENQLFQKLTGIGNNEEVLLYQAFDEMMGHQYGNTQQRINETASLLDKEFTYLRHDWRNPSKQNNKIKVFGMRNEYNSDTAGIIDYRSNAYGVAYVHEDEKIKMGNSSGWYAGAVTNRFKFKDIGKSRENQTILKAGVFKTMSPKKDHNGALQWTIGADAFVGINDMRRRYLVVNEVFEAKSNYNSYGAALKTDLGYDIRMSERTHLRPYGSLKMEYGRFNSIREKSGQVRLEVEGNDYFSVKPEVGAEFRYVQPLAVRTNLTVGLKAAYENELGKVGSVNNRGRVRYTTADWFGIRGEKEDRKGNGKFDLNIGVDNTRFGVTVNAGYDTKGKNVRGGIGFRAIY